MDLACVCVVVVAHNQCLSSFSLYNNNILHSVMLP